MQLWLEMNELQRMLWMSGAVDGYLSGLSRVNPNGWNHFNDCTIRAKLNRGAFAQRVHAFVIANPKMQNGTPGGAAIVFPDELCGPAPR